VAAGYGITPYGIGDWGSENTVIPDTNSLSIQTTAPVVDSGVIPTGGAVLVGSAPSVVIFERIKIPGSAVLGIVGHAPTVLQNFRITPAANDSILVGGQLQKLIYLPLLRHPQRRYQWLEQRQQHTHQVCIFCYISNIYRCGILAGVAPLSVVGDIFQPGRVCKCSWPNAETATTYTPGTGSINVQGHAPSLVREEVVTPTGGAVLIGSAPVVIVRNR
jgi:hypothetical protein